MATGGKAISDTIGQAVSGGETGGTPSLNPEDPEEKRKREFALESACAAANIPCPDFSTLFSRYSAYDQVEIQRLMGEWGQGSFGSAEDSIIYHVAKHARELGLDSKDILTYMRKAHSFKIKGARRIKLDYDPFNSSKSGLYCYKKAGEYVIKDVMGKILSYGKIK